MRTFAMPDPGPVLGALLAGAALGRPAVVLTEDHLEVRLGLGWRSTVPRADIVAAGHDPRHPISIGAHGWRGDWLVNTSGHGLVRIDLDPPGRGRVFGVPVRLRTLRLSLADPDAFLAALGAPSGR
ncbi:hypothetical protein [Phycicoccus avicenniae]|uniref:hypothetical protein n=1 Tax=Phycicoccus avicenniae TaxID=2828860 RepID=UPI003D29D1CE